jgi:glyoxylase-like metal-dependent hydrolase (beta-lactamase superfamily II)
MKISIVNTGYFKLDGGAMFGVVPKSIWHKINPADDNNMCTWAMRCLLVQTENRNILIDTGIGNKQSDKFFSHYYLHGSDTLTSSLHALGLDNKDITDVFLTHLHFDHCGGAIQREADKLVPSFNNATYWSNKKHWDWAMTPNDRERVSFLADNIMPIKECGQLQFVNEPNSGALSNFAQGVNVYHTYGHTESMMLPMITMGNTTFVYMADLLPSHGHVPLPYVMAYDMFPMKTLTEKKVFLDLACQNGYVLLFEHDPKYEACTLKQENGKYVIDKLGMLNDFL